MFLPGFATDRRRSRHAAVEEAPDTRQEVDEPARPGIDHTGCRQLGKRLLRPLERFRQRRRGSAQQLCDRLGARDLAAKRLGPFAHHREHRPFFRLRDCLVRATASGRGRLGEALRRHLGRIADPLRESAQELGEDDSGVAPRTDERFLRDRSGRLPGGRRDGRQLERIREGGDDVRAGVPVRHREHVDAIQVVLAVAKRDKADRERRAELLPVESTA